MAKLGPGATNLVTGVANANMDNSPVVAVTGQGATTRLHKESHQAMDVVGMFRPITKWAMSIQDERTIPEVVRKAFKLASAVLNALPQRRGSSGLCRTVSWRVVAADRHG